VSFLALVISLVLNRAWVGHGQVLHRDGWYHAWREKLRSSGFSPAVRLGLEILVPVLLVHLALDALRPLPALSCSMPSAGAA
jgi:hypothetical protein